MRFLIFILFLSLWSQDVYSIKSNLDETILPQRATAQLRSIGDMWNSVKKSAINAWESVRNIAQHTGERINVWIQNVKTKANDLKAMFKIRIQKMKQEINNLIASIKITGETVKECMRKQQTAIEEIIKQILQSVTTCISQNTRYLPILEETTMQLLNDKDEFIRKVEKELQTCLDSKDIEECFNDVRKNVYNDLENEEKDILKLRDEARAYADDILNTIVSCTANGLIDASAAITNTTIQIIQCVSNAQLITDL